MTLGMKQKTAIALAADRLANLVNTCPEDHRPLDPTCPFCADELAYEALLAAFPSVIERERPPEGKPISFQDLRRGVPDAT